MKYMVQVSIAQHKYTLYRGRGLVVRTAVRTVRTVQMKI
jgi:hypothetical protein